MADSEGLEVEGVAVQVVTLLMVVEVILAVEVVTAEGALSYLQRSEHW